MRPPLPSAVVPALVLWVLCHGAACAEPGGGASTTLSQASTASFEGGSALVSGLAEGASYTLVALAPLGEGVLAVFEASGTATRISLELSGAAARAAGRGLGEVVEVVAVAGGAMLKLGGEAIAFVPNQLQRGLQHRRKVSR